jgi:hypothetical protein
VRVLLITDWPSPDGGVETYLTSLRAALEEAGDDVRLLASSAGSAGNGHADYVSFGTDRRSRQVALQLVNPSAVAAARRAVRALQPDVAYVSMFEMHLSPAVFAPLRHLPTVLNISYYKPICPTGLKLLPDGRLCDVRAGAVCWRGGCTSLPHWLRDGLATASSVQHFAAAIGS